jgi:hypothetical protein
MSQRHEEWARGYVKQAKSDFEVYVRLKSSNGMPECQSLHFLQMACENLCKAYLCGNAVDPEVLRKSHASIAHPLPVIARQQYARLSRVSLKSYSRPLTIIRHLAREIELLHPSVTDGGIRPDNCEYPWEDSKGVQVPVEYTFPRLNLLREPFGRLLLKLIPAAINDLLESLPA